MQSNCTAEGAEDAEEFFKKNSPSSALSAVDPPRQLLALLLGQLNELLRAASSHRIPTLAGQVMPMSQR